MSSGPEKTSSTKTATQVRQGEGPFFRRAGESSFFAARDGHAPDSQPFFRAAIQPKLEVSHPEDPQEREAEAVADTVMRTSDAAPAAPAEEEREGGGGAISRAPEVQRLVQRRPSLPTIARLGGAGGFPDHDAPEESGGGAAVQAKAEIHRSHAFLTRRARGPPGPAQPSADQQFEQALGSSKGTGSALPRDTRASMEDRFGADFGGVRVHTSTSAVGLSGMIHAQAFTHGNDIYFNSGKYAPGTTVGDHLLAHELTHTIQQGASPARAPAAASSSGSAAQATGSRVAPARVAASAVARQISRAPGQGLPRLIQRAEAGAQRNAAVALATGEQGKVSANETGPDGKRQGWERLIEYFKTTFGPDRILPEGAAFQPGTVGEAQIKTKSTFRGDVPGGDGVTTLHNQPRDAMPSWCGIFAFWALNKGGIPLRKWQLGGASVIPPEAAYPPGYQPQPGDIAFRREFSHYALVASADGASVTSVNGNTSGEDHMGGQIQVQTHPRDHWFAFFNPTLMMEGSLRAPGDPDAAGAAPVRSLKDLRQKLFQVNRKPDATAAGPTTAAGPVTSAAPKATAATQATPVARAEEASGSAEKEEQDGGETSVVSRQVTPQAAPSAGLRSWTAPVPDPARASPDVQRLADPAAAPAGAKTQGRLAQRQPMSLHNRGPPRAPPVIQALAARKIQRGWLGDAWDAVSGAISEAAAWVERGLDAAKEWLLGKVRDFVASIPGYRMLCLILGEDPITGAPAPLTGATLLEAGLELLPLGHMFRSLMRRLGIYDDVATWLHGRIEDLGALASGIGDRFVRFWDSLSLSDVGDPDGVMNRVAELLRGTISDIVGFVERAASEFLAMVKRVMLREVAGFVRTRIPRLYPLLTVALGFDPATNQEVQRNGTNILYALLEVSEDGREQRKQMMETGTFQRIAGWIDRGIAVFSRAYQLLRAAISGIWDFVTIENLFSPVQTFTRIWDQFSEPVRIVGQFLIDAAIEILKVIKNALLSRLSAFARETRGYPLLCVIIGRDPFTGEVVPRTVHNVVRGFMSLMEGGEQQYEQLRQSGAIDRIVAKVEAAVERLNMTPRAIIQLFIDLWNSLSIRDLASPIQAFRRIVAAFGAPILRLIRFVIEILMIVVEAILILMNFPFDLIANIIDKARQAWELIKQDPAGFFKNLLRAIKQGFIQFFDHILTHLINGVTGWLMSELRDAGIPVLTDFSLGGVIRWLLQVLGISMDKIWEKLAAHPRIGPARVARIRSIINTLEGAWTFIRDVQERGMAAIWDKIQEKLSSIWDVILDAVKNWIMERIIGAVVTKLLSMLDPTGIMAVVNSAIAIYKAVQSFIRYLTQMLQVVNSFVEGVLEIASGNITRAADALEGALDRAMPIVIGFLANQVGLGGVGHRIGEMVQVAREKVDEALTWLVNKAVDTGFALIDRAMAMGRSAVAAVRRWLGLEKTFTAKDNTNHKLYMGGSESSPVLMVQSNPRAFHEFIDGVTIDANDPEKSQKEQAKASAVTVAGQIDARKASRLPGETDEEKIAAVQTLLDSLAIHTAWLFGDVSQAGEPTVLWPAQQVNFGKSMTAVRLNKRQGLEGSSPTSSPNMEYGVLNQRRDPGNPDASYYVKGHLLNERLGGEGGWRNLTPLSRDGNSSHESQVESLVKAAFDSSAVVEYNVTAVYGWGGNASVIPDTDPDATVKKAIIAQEVNVPTALSCEAHRLEKNGATYERKQSIVVTSVPNPIGQTADSYVLSTASRILDYAQLHTEVTNLLASPSPGTWSQFQNKDRVHRDSVAGLQPAGRNTLEGLFGAHERQGQKEVELARVTAMNTANDIQTWPSFMAGRVFFDVADPLRAQVQGAFDVKQASLRNGALAAAASAVTAAPAGTRWIDFKLAQNINFSGLSPSEQARLTTIQTSFENHQRSLS